MGIPWRGLRCRAGAAGLLCRAAGASQPLAKKAAGPPPTRQPRHFGEGWILFFPGMPGRNVLESISGTCASELETGTNHFLVAARVEFGTGNRHVPFFFGVARVEFRVEFPGSASTCPGQVRRNFRQWSTGQLKTFFAEVVGLDDNLDIFFAGKNSPWARQAGGFYAGQARPVAR